MALPKLLVDDNGKQEILEVEPATSFYDPTKVLWDEREHGPLPVIQLGGMVIATDSPRTLKFDQARADASAIVTAAEQAKIDAKLARMNILRNVGAVSTLPELRAVVEAIVIELGMNK